MTYYHLLPSPIGQLLVTSDGSQLTGLFLENHKGGPAIGSDWIQEPARFEEVHDQLGRYFEGSLKEFQLDIRTSGTPFQESVWDLLKTIPFGQTVTYGELASRLGLPKASRAVGTAVGKNPISIVVPCHRVLGAGGAITGYAGGIARKQALLELESSGHGQLALRHAFVIPI